MGKLLPDLSHLSGAEPALSPGNKGLRLGIATGLSSPRRPPVRAVSEPCPQRLMTIMGYLGAHSRLPPRSKTYRGLATQREGALLRPAQSR